MALTKVAVQVPVNDSVQTLCRHFALGSRLDVPTRLTPERKEGGRGFEAEVVEQLTKLIHASQAPRARARMKKSLASDERVVAREEVFVVAEEVVVFKRRTTLGDVSTVLDKPIEVANSVAASLVRRNGDVIDAARFMTSKLQMCAMVMVTGSVSVRGMSEW